MRRGRRRRGPESVKGERRAADLATGEASDRMVEFDGCGAVVQCDDRSLNVLQVAGAGMPVDADAVADHERRQGGHGADGVQEMLARVDRLGERREVKIERAVCDLLEQQALRI